MKQQQTISNRIEITYLAILRIVILVIATLVVGLTIFLLGDGARKSVVSTDVKAKPVSVAPAEVLATVASAKKSEETSAKADSGDGRGKAFKSFLESGTFTSYYSVYLNLARQFNKADDVILNKERFAQQLGYTQDTYAAGEDDTIKRFVEDPGYGAQILAVANGLATDARVAGKLRQYQSAQKTARACSVAYVPKRVWDSSSTSCNEWWATPVGCAVVREVPVEQCAAAYPAGITSPLDAFAQMDRGFRATWTAQSEKNSAEAAAELAKREAAKADAVPTLVRAAYVFGAFLFIMFLFLVVAIERHLRGIATAAKVQAAQPGPVRLEAAE